MQYILNYTEAPDSATLAGYERAGGYRGFRKALGLEPAAVIDIVKKSGLRGRGGAGFPTGMKWLFAFHDPKTPKYLLCNADEGEPGTFKDRRILEKAPHLLIEGMLIAARALKAEQGYIYLRGEYPAARKILELAIAEAYEKGYLGENVMGSGGRFHLSICRNAGAYICGEETALINSLEGKRGQPRLKPPFPVSVGAFGKPTVVNNVETLANLPFIMEAGPEAYLKIGNPQCPGNKLFPVSGHVDRPGLYELPMGTPLKEIIHNHAGGVKGGKALKAVIPGGISAPVLTADMTDCPMDFISLPRYGSMLGSGAVMVFDETTCMVKVAWRALKFFEYESCGKCTPCREGTGWLRTVLERIEAGGGRHSDIALLEDICNNIIGKTFCPLGDGAAFAALNFIKHFRADFEAHMGGRCPYENSAKSPGAGSGRPAA
ncbi:MAG: NADH-quinone oxidoreductase subunit NuoF [Nitrospiraceae bacterium]|nr:NADH-quinone oxidoreductase subunit NuoF [Nitrospiraceae bacterium]